MDFPERINTRKTHPTSKSKRLLNLLSWKGFTPFLNFQQQNANTATMNTDTPETDKNLDGREVIDRIYRERDEEREETIRWMSIAEGRNAKDVAAAETDIETTENSNATLNQL